MYMVKTITIIEAQTLFDEITQDVMDNNTEYLITENNIPVARLVPPFSGIITKEFAQFVEEFSEKHKEDLQALA